MSRPVLTSTEGVLHQDADNQAAGRPQYRQSVSPHWSDTEEEGTGNQATSQGHYHSANEYGEPLSSPMPHSEQDHRIDGGQILPNSGINFRPRVEGPPDYVEDGSGRRERYIINESGDRVPWPFPDHEQSSDDGIGDSDMVYAESGCIIPRSEWEAGRSWEPSSDDSSEDTDQNPSHSHRSPMPRMRNRTPSEDANSDHEIPEVRNGQPAGFRGSRRQRIAEREGRSHHGNGGSLQLDPQAGHRSDR